MAEQLTTQTLTQIEAFLKPAVDAGAIPRSEFLEAMERLRGAEDHGVPPVKQSRMLTKQQYAQLMGVSPPTVNRWMQNGFIKFFRTPTAGAGYGHVRIPADEIPSNPATSAGEGGLR